MKYIKLILVSLMLIFSASAVFADVITETPEIFSFKLENSTANEAKFSFGVNNQKSFINKYNYVLKLEDAKGNLIAEKVFKDGIVFSGDNQIKGELFSFQPENDLEVKRAILYLTDSAGTVLSLSIIDNLNLSLKANGIGEKEISCQSIENNIECNSKTNLSNIESINLEIFKGTVYGESIKKETIFADKLKKEKNKLNFKIENLKPGYYQTYIKIDGFKKTKVDFYIDGEISSINSVIITSAGKEKGDVIKLNISAEKKSGPAKLDIALLANDGSVCTVDELDFSDSGKYSLELDKTCEVSTVVVYMLDSENNILDSYNGKELSRDDIHTLLMSKKNNSGLSNFDPTNPKVLGYGLAILILFISIILFFTRMKKVGAALLVLAIVIALFIFSYGKVSAETITNNSWFENTTVNVSPTPTTDTNVNVSIHFPGTIFRTDVELKIFLDDELKKTVNRGNVSQDISHSFGQLDVGTYNVKVEFNSKAIFGVSKFGQSRFGENIEVVTIPVNVTQACSGSTYWTVPLDAGAQLCQDTQSVEMCDNGTVANDSDDYITGNTRTITGTKNGAWGSWEPFNPDTEYGGNPAHACSNKTATRDKKCTDSYGNNNILQDTETWQGTASTTVTWNPSVVTNTGDYCSTENATRTTRCGNEDPIIETPDSTAGPSDISKISGKSCCETDGENWPQEPDQSKYCKNVQTTITSSCGNTRTINGQMDKIWGPSTASECVGEDFSQTTTCLMADGAPDSKPETGTDQSGDCSALQCSTDKINWRSCGEGERVPMTGKNSSLYVRTARDVANIPSKWTENCSVEKSQGQLLIKKSKTFSSEEDKSSSRAIEINEMDWENSDDGEGGNNKLYSVFLKADGYSAGCEEIKLRYINPVVKEV